MSLFLFLEWINHLARIVNEDQTSPFNKSSSFCLINTWEYAWHWRIWVSEMCQLQCFFTLIKWHRQKQSKNLWLYSSLFHRELLSKSRLLKVYPLKSLFLSLIMGKSSRKTRLLTFLLIKCLICIYFCPLERNLFLPPNSQYRPSKGPGLWCT